MTPEQLDVIRTRARQYTTAIGPGGENAWLAGLLAADVPKLLAEVEQLRAELTATRNNRLISAIFGHHKGAPRPFALYRTGEVRDSGLIALGAEFPDGAVALRLANDGGWTTKSEGGAEGITPGYATIVWLSDELESLAEMEQDRDRLSDELRDATAEIECYRNALRRIRDLASPLRHAHSTFTEIARIVEPALRLEVWDSSVPPGGYVCAVCRTPVESEPCTEHSGTEAGHA